MSEDDTPRILFVHQPTVGLRHDVLVMASAVSVVLPGAQFHSFELPNGAELHPEGSLRMPDWLKALMPFQFVVFLEHLVPCAPLYDPALCRRRIYVPNHEWITRQDEIALTRYPLDAVLYKNASTRDIFEGLEGAAEIPVRHLTGWTSEDIGAPDGAETPDFTRFLHVRGVSVQKQTDVVIDTWLANPDFPLLTVLARMRDDFAVPVPMRAAPNLEIVVQRLETARLRSLQRAHGIHVAPSLAEGFGHSLNEARACGAVLVTTDGPPMAEFVEPGVSGMLVPAEAGRIRMMRRSRAYPVTPTALAATVRALLDLPLAERAAMGAAGRARYLSDKRAFEAAVAELFRIDGLLAAAQTVSSQ
jgi:hypothetical protein